MIDCMNLLIIKGPVRSLNDFSTRATGEAAVYPPEPACGKPIIPLSFHAIVPVPQDLLSKPHADGGRTWELQNWGCSRGASHIRAANQPDGSLLYYFVTFDAPPTRWLDKASKVFPALSFELFYHDFSRDIDGNFIIRDGVEENSQQHEPAATAPNEDIVTRARRSAGFSD